MRVWLQRARLQDMSHLDPFHGEMSRHENRAMTLQGVLLRAHERDGVLAHSRLQSLQSFPKQTRGSEARLTDATALVTRAVLAAGAKLFTQERVPDAVFREGSLERLAIELRVEAAIGLRPDTGDRCDVMLVQQSDEALDRVIGMADRVDHEGGMIAAMSL